MNEFASVDNPKATGKEWHGCGYPQYNPEIHLPMIREIFSNGGGVSAFLAACEISKPTFYQWLKDKPEFRQQYDIALSEGAAVWDLMPLAFAKNGATIPHAYWAMIRRQRYKEPVVSINEAKEDSTSSRMKAAWETLQEGAITTQEFNQIASGLSTESRIAEVDLQKQALDHAKESSDIMKGMKDEAIKVAVEAYNEVMNRKEGAENE